MRPIPIKGTPPRTEFIPSYIWNKSDARFIRWTAHETFFAVVLWGGLHDIKKSTYAGWCVCKNTSPILPPDFLETIGVCVATWQTTWLWILSSTRLWGPPRTTPTKPATMAWWEHKKWHHHQQSLLRLSPPSTWNKSCRRSSGTWRWLTARRLQRSLVARRPDSLEEKRDWCWARGLASALMTEAGSVHKLFKIPFARCFKHTLYLFTGLCWTVSLL